MLRGEAQVDRGQLGVGFDTTHELDARDEEFRTGSLAGRILMLTTVNFMAGTPDQVAPREGAYGDICDGCVEARGSTLPSSRPAVSEVCRGTGDLGS